MSGATKERSQYSQHYKDTRVFNQRHKSLIALILDTTLGRYSSIPVYGDEPPHLSTAKFHEQRVYFLHPQRLSAGSDQINIGNGVRRARFLTYTIAMRDHDESWTYLWTGNMSRWQCSSSQRTTKPTLCESFLLKQPFTTAASVLWIWPNPCIQYKK